MPCKTPGRPLERVGGVTAVQSLASCLDANQAHRIIDEGMEEADGVAAAADAGHGNIRQAALGGLELRFGFITNHALEIAHE